MRGLVGTVLFAVTIFLATFLGGALLLASITPPSMPELTPTVSYTPHTGESFTSIARCIPGVEGVVHATAQELQAQNGGGTLYAGVPVEVPTSAIDCLEGHR